MNKPRTVSDPIWLLPIAITEALKQNGILAFYAGARIYHISAPPGTPGDCVEHRRQAGGSLSDSPRSAFDVTWEVVGLSANQDHASAMAEAIQDTMTGGGILIPGWSVYAVFPGDWIARSLYIEATQYFSIGKFYDIKGAKRS